MLKNKMLKLKRVLAIGMSMLLCPLLPISVAAEEDILLGITIGDLSVPGFSDEIMSYEVSVPYYYSEGDFTVAEPDIRLITEQGMQDADSVTWTETWNGVEGTAVVNVAENAYTLNLSAVGVNQYIDGGFEQTELDGSTPKYWRKAAGIDTGTGADTVLKIESDSTAYAGNSYMSVSGAAGGNKRYTQQNEEKEFDDLVIDSEKRYIFTNMIRLDQSVAEDTAKTQVYLYECALVPAHGTPVSIWTGEAGSEESSGIEVDLTKDWTRCWALIENENLRYKSGSSGPKRDRHVGVYSGSTNYDVDEYYFGEAVISAIEYNGTLEAMIPARDAESHLSLSVSYKNQFGGEIGLDEAITQWTLTEEYSGVTLEDDEIIITGEASAGDIFVRCEASPGEWSAAKVAKTFKINLIPYTPDAALLDISFGDVSIPGFDPQKANYELMLPYRYQPNVLKLTELPEITCIPFNPDSEIEIEEPQNIENGIVKIHVTAPSGAKQDYFVTLRSAGSSMYKDGGFEQGVWSKANGSACTLTQIDENPAAGQYAMKVSGGAFRNYAQSPAAQMSADVVYIASSQIRLDDPEGKEYEARYDINGLHNDTKGAARYYNSNGEEITNMTPVKSDWTCYYMMCYPNQNVAVQHYYTNWEASEPTYVVDEFYLGELIVATIDCEGKTVEIPSDKTGESHITLSALSYNQFGNRIGLGKETYEWKLAYNYPGVTINGNTLIVTGEATEQTILVRCECTPNFANSQGKLAKTIKFNLTADGLSADVPRADNLIASGEVALGNVLTATYDYYHAKNVAPGIHQNQWCWSDTMNGVFNPIPGATDTSYTVMEDYRNKYIRFEVIPVSADGVEGEKSVSNVLSIPSAPVAKDPMITGVGAVGKTFKGSYEYYDVNGDAESGTSYRWLISDKENGEFTAIEGETSLNYVVRESDVDKYLRFEVTPKNENAPLNEGKAVLSPVVLCAARPVVEDVKIKRVAGGNFSVSYKYKHPLNIASGKTRIEWTVDGEAAGNTDSIVVNSRANSLITVTVTPVASLEPFEGKSVTASYNYKVESVSKGGGGLGGGPSIVPVPEIPKAPEAAPESPRHWAADAIDFVKQNGIMQDLKPDDFAGGEIVSRADFVLYIIKALGESESDYNLEFVDVSNEEYYAGALQKAVELGIISRDTNFHPQRSVSREEICKILVMALNIKEETSIDLSKFVDANQVAQWAQSYVTKAVNTGLLLGVSEKEFLPKGIVTRNQTAVIIKRLYDYKNGGGEQ